VPPIEVCGAERLLLAPASFSPGLQFRFGCPSDAANADPTEHDNRGKSWRFRKICWRCWSARCAKSPVKLLDDQEWLEVLRVPQSGIRYADDIPVMLPEESVDA